MVSTVLTGCSQKAPSGDTTPPAGEELETETKTGEEDKLRDEFIMLATTTSTYDSGLLDELLPVFEEKYGIEVRVLSKGTGQCLELGKRGDIDLLLVHDRASELKLVEEGFFVDRHDVMYNDFVIVGPAKDPAGIKGMEKATEALSAVSTGKHSFVSRGDDSGTHRMELSLWEKAGVKEFGSWYSSVGQGMGDTLRMADEMEGYALTDRGTYVSLKKTLELEILLEGDPALFNQYGIMAVNPHKHSHVKYDSAMKLIEFFRSDECQDLIASFKKHGEILFFPGLGVED
ncbi:MAG: tungsten ABC transporter substrate-binding protein [Firmicutes bacterium HGW-Firmicutes-13]|nr:MAG: tungsten ABC transporter substrate-binding protein [Firmicutes bacterium HGW-Firmicutes-13]